MIKNVDYYEAAEPLLRLLARRVNEDDEESGYGVGFLGWLAEEIGPAVGSSS